MITDFLVCATARGARLFVAQKKIGCPGRQITEQPAQRNRCADSCRTEDQLRNY